MSFEWEKIWHADHRGKKGKRIIRRETHESGGLRKLREYNVFTLLYPEEGT